MHHCTLLSSALIGRYVSMQTCSRCPFSSLPKRAVRVIPYRFPTRVCLSVSIVRACIDMHCNVYLQPSIRCKTANSRQVAASVRSALVSIQTAVSLRSTHTSELISAMQAQNRASFSAQAAFDGIKNLFTTKKLNDGAVSFTRACVQSTLLTLYFPITV